MQRKPLAHTFADPCCLCLSWLGSGLPHWQKAYQLLGLHVLGLPKAMGQHWLWQAWARSWPWKLQPVQLGSLQSLGWILCRI